MHTHLNFKFKAALYGRTYIYLKYNIIPNPLRESFKSPVPHILRESFKSSANSHETSRGETILSQSYGHEISRAY